MPLYEYECPKCHARTTLLRRIDSRDEPVRCAGGGPDGSEPGHIGLGPLMQMKLSAPNVHFNGYGFTRTPAILKDPIAKGVNAQQGKVNWGTASAAEFGSGE